MFRGLSACLACLRVCWTQPWAYRNERTDRDVVLGVYSWSSKRHVRVLDGVEITPRKGELLRIILGGSYLEMPRRVGDRCGVLLPMIIGLFLCVSGGHNHERCWNGWTDRDAIWSLDSNGPKEPRIRYPMMQKSIKLLIKCLTSFVYKQLWISKELVRWMAITP